MLTTDTFSEIGSQHKICQDYCISSEFPFIVLSDGCSSSKNTDMGSRILCHLAKQYLTYNKNFLEYVEKDQFGDWIINNAELTARQLGLTDTCLDATLIVAYLSSNFLHINFYGDGMLVVENSNGCLETVNISYSLNSPYYLSYKINPKRKLDYHAMKVTKRVLNFSEYTNIQEEHPQYNIAEEIAYDHIFSLKIDLSKKDYKKIMICTDGIESFLKENEKPTQKELLKILRSCLDFKTTAGEFLKRRMSRVLKDLKSEGWDHYDDLTAGAILLE